MSVFTMVPARDSSASFRILLTRLCSFLDTRARLSIVLLRLFPSMWCTSSSVSRGLSRCIAKIARCSSMPPLFLAIFSRMHHLSLGNLLYDTVLYVFFSGRCALKLSHLSISSFSLFLASHSSLQYFRFLFSLIGINSIPHQPQLLFAIPPFQLLLNGPRAIFPRHCLHKPVYLTLFSFVWFTCLIFPQDLHGNSLLLHFIWLLSSNISELSSRRLT